MNVRLEHKCDTQRKGVNRHFWPCSCFLKTAEYRLKKRAKSWFKRFQTRRGGLKPGLAEALQPIPTTQLSSLPTTGSRGYSASSNAGNSNFISGTITGGRSLKR